MTKPAHPSLWRYFIAAWQRRADLTPHQACTAEAEFLPGTLQLQAAPPSPTATWISRSLLLCLLTLSVWACVGQLDIVAQAPAVVVPSQGVQVLASPATTQVKAIHVREGSRVKAGDLLVELDATLPTHEQDAALAESRQARAELDAASQLLARQQRSLNGRMAPAAAASGTSDDLRDAAWLEYEARVARIRAELAPIEDALAAVSAQARDMRELLDQQLVSRQALGERELQRKELESRAAALRMQLALDQAEFRRAQTERAERARGVLQRAHLAEAKAQTLGQAYVLRAPVAGTVHRLVLSTIGGTVSAAQPVLEIVPDGGLLELEAQVSNRDIGFVHVGQDVAVKLDTYDSSRHGNLQGKLVYLSADAVHDERSSQAQAPHFKARIAIDAAAMRLPVSPGMTATAEIHTGRRTVAEYLLSPLAAGARSSLKER